MTVPGVWMKTPQAPFPVPGLHANGVFLYATPVLTPSASCTCEWISCPRLSSGPNFSPRPYTGSPVASANAADHRPPWRRRPNVGRRVPPRMRSSVIERRIVAPPRIRRMASGEPLISSDVSVAANVHVPGSRCATLQALARATTMP